MSHREHPTPPLVRLPPTTESLFDDSARPYFLWWTDATVGQLKEHLASITGQTAAQAAE